MTVKMLESRVKSSLNIVFIYFYIRTSLHPSNILKVARLTCFQSSNRCKTAATQVWERLETPDRQFQAESTLFYNLGWLKITELARISISKRAMMRTCACLVTRQSSSNINGVTTCDLIVDQRQSRASRAQLNSWQ